MCGICGIVASQTGSIHRMVAAMHHRGPDDSGVFVDGEISLGMTRLAILDTSERGHQPMSTPDGLLAIVYNGELYNYSTEKRSLEQKGYLFRSTSDTEVVLRMYEEYGEDCVLRMRGMFAMAVLDKRHHVPQLFLARDHLGIKPLLYARRGGSFVFASEMKAILVSGLIERRIDTESLRLLLTFGSVTQPRTIIQGVEMLLPGHRMMVRRGRIRLERYWSLDVDRLPLRHKSYEEQLEHLEAALRESVRLQMLSDVPLGAFLSGGVDSSLIVALMAGETDGRLKTFSVGFKDQDTASTNETRLAEETARSLGTEHENVMIDAHQMLDRLHHIIDGLDQPSVDGVNSYFVSLAARHSVTVALSGTGGDELFGGYPWFTSMVQYSTKQSPRGVKRSARHFLSRLATHPWLDDLVDSRFGLAIEKGRQNASFLGTFARQYHIFPPREVVRLLSPGIRSAVQAGRDMGRDLACADELPFAGPVDRVTGLCVRGYLQNQLLRDIDAASMIHSLEVRVPLVDPEIADIALSLSQEAKIGRVGKDTNPWTSLYNEIGMKRALVDLSRKYLTRDMGMQPKRGFTLPFDSWLRSTLKSPMLDTLSGRALNDLPIDHNEAKRVADDFFAGRSHWSRPWLLMVTCLWAGRWLSGPTHPIRA
jgi:asparagine synthase (glutamine-hydrolysing)